MRAKRTAIIIPTLDNGILEEHRPPKTFHASGLLDCERKQILGLLGYDEVRVSKPEWRRAADIGNAIHDMITATCKATEILEAAEVPLEANEFRVGGRIDAIIKRDGVRRVLEIKSKNSRGYNAFQPGDDGFDSAYAQLQWYLWALRLDRGYIICVNRNDMKWVEWQIEYDDPYMIAMLVKLRRLNEMLAAGTLPTPERGKCIFCGYQGTEACPSIEDNWI